MARKKPNVFQTAVRTFLRELVGAKPASPYRRQPISKSLRYRVLERDGHKCVICGRSANSSTPVELQVDHIIPVSKGGTNRFKNLRTLCTDCNLGKGARWNLL